jgi:hypothetical protein
MTIKVGDKVAYSVQFLASIGEGATSDLAHGRGEVTEIKEYSSAFAIAGVRWDNPELPDKVNVKNLAIVGANSRFCKC